MSDRNEISDEMTRRAYGLLATSLNEALIDMRQALESHATLLPKGRVADVDALLEEFTRRRVRIALYGEVKAGKSTLLNALAGAELSPVAFDPLTSIPVRVTYGSQTVWQVGAHRLDNIAELTQLMRAGVRDATEVVIETDADLLQLGGQVDLVDTPGVGSEERFDAISADALRSLDAVVLVVRYPALYTQVTRRLMEGLQADIGKLFVIWNLDADCAELTDEERRRQGEKLRAEVAGAHELYLVDARAAFRAGSKGDKAKRVASGLDEFTAALGRFASSDKRQVAALREASKRALGWIEEAQRSFGERRNVLDSRIGETRDRLQKVQSAADAKASAARAQFAEVQAAMASIGQERAAAVTAAGEGFHKALRGARRTWVRNGRITELDAAIGAAAEVYADACATANRSAAEALREAAKRFGAVVSVTPPERGSVRPGSLAPLERIERALGGSARVLRRAIWKRWYLPGLTALERMGIGGDVASQGAWFEQATKSAEQGARNVVDGRLADIARSAQADLERIRVETNFLAEEAEYEGLIEHVPALGGQRERIAEIGKEARGLI